MKILVFVHLLSIITCLTLLEIGVEFNDLWWNRTCRENCQRKSQYCSDPLGSDHLRQAENPLKVTAIFVTQPKSAGCSHVWSGRIRTVHSDIRHPMIHSNGKIRMKHLDLVSLQFSSPSSFLHVAPLSSVQFGFSAAMSNILNDTTSKLHTQEPQKCGTFSLDP